MADKITKPERKRDIGFTFEQIGERTLDTGQTVPAFRGRPNDPVAHERAIKYVEKDVKKAS